MIIWISTLLIEIIAINGLYAQDWQLLGDTFESTVFSRFGHATALNADGTRIAIGAPLDETLLVDSGKVEVYEWTGVQWTLLGDPIYSDLPIEGGRFGERIDMDASGTRLVISEPGYAGVGIARGAVHVYIWSGIEWQLLSKLVGDADLDFFGSGDVGISADGSTIVVGSPQYGIANKGQVKVFVDIGGAFQQLGGSIVGNTPTDFLGSGVAINEDGSRIVIGVQSYTTNTSQDIGAVFIYQWDTDLNTWVLLGEFFGDQNSRRLGWRVDMDDSGEVVIASAFEYSTNNLPGEAYVFKEGSSGWELFDTPILGTQLDLFGWDVAISGDGSTLAVSAPDIDIVNTGAGMVFTYRVSGNAIVPYLNPVLGQLALERLGSGLDFNFEGNIFSVGAPYINDNLGLARVYKDEILSLSENSPWENTILFPNPTQNEITIQTPEDLHGLTVSLYDSLGRSIVISKKLEHTGNQTLILPNDSGVYFLKMTYNGKTITKKIIKE